LHAETARAERPFAPLWRAFAAAAFGIVVMAWIVF
jgi:hypothetical protein